MEKYLKLPGISRLILVNGIMKITRTNEFLKINYTDGTLVTIDHGSGNDPRANIAELEAAMTDALATKWDEVVHPVTLSVAPEAIT